MTLEEYRYKREHMEQLYPCPFEKDDPDAPEVLDYYRDLVLGWEEELSPEDYALVQERRRRFERRMQSEEGILTEEEFEARKKDPYYSGLYDDED